MMTAYLDNSATTKPTKEVADKVYEMLTDNFGNASSFHKMGLDAMFEVRKARQNLANALSCDLDEIIFTSGGTEANNLAILGAVDANKRKGNRIVTTSIEHESVLQTCDYLETKGFEVIKLDVDEYGYINPNDLYNAINKDTILVSMMYVNNEVGSIMPIKEIKKAVKQANSPALIHVDCVQAFGKLDVKPKKLGADLLTVTAHKIHGPKGIGALYIKKGVRILPRTYGGEQEKRIRPGTESTPLIAGFGKAVEQIPNLKKQSEKTKELNQYLRQELEKIDGIIINSSPNASDYIMNIYVPTFMTSQTVVQHLSSQYGVYVSNGSACAKGKRSHVLTAMKLNEKTIDKSIRVSFSRDNTIKDVDMFINAIKETIKTHPEK